MTPENQGEQIGTMRFCSVCSNYLFLKEDDSTHLQLLCRHCGYQQRMAPTTASDALVLETTFNVATNQKQTVSQLNEYTKLDPTLPHLKTIACPNEACSSQADPNLRDILYIKTDAKNLKYQYSCKVCNTQWGS
jgi:DNA-directed RNA polymerase subunit M/transcription elongation factor TFIIS